tara:strand:+ start:18 stop:200 length:183 start_codon:yes stop_codon:yes gene_type:complete
MIEQKSEKELFELGFKAAKDGHHISYDPFRNRKLDTKKKQRQNSAWMKGYKSYYDNKENE